MPRRGTKTDPNQRTLMRPSTSPNPASNPRSEVVTRPLLVGYGKAVTKITKRDSRIGFLTHVRLVDHGRMLR